MVRHFKYGIELRYKFVVMKVIRSSDCGHSPKQKLLEDMSVALAGADAGLIDSLTVPELVWLHIGKKSVEGQDAVLSAIRKSGPATEVAIEKVVSHGRAGRQTRGILPYVRVQQYEVHSREVDLNIFGCSTMNPLLA